MLLHSDVTKICRKDAFKTCFLNNICIIIVTMCRGCTGRLCTTLIFVSFEGLIGPISFDEIGDIKGGAISIFEVKAKKLEVIDIVK